MIINGATLIGTRVVDGSVLTNNLLIWLDANNASSYSGTGTTVNDLSGNGYTHTLSSSGIYTVLNGVKCFDCTSTGQVTVTSSSASIFLKENSVVDLFWARLPVVQLLMVKVYSTKMDILCYWHRPTLQQLLTIQLMHTKLHTS